MHDRTDHIGAMSSMVDAMSSMTALTKTEERESNSARMVASLVCPG